MKYKINIIDDEKQLNDLVRTYLEKEGYECTSFYTYDEALMHCDDDVHLWLVDIMLDKDTFKSTYQIMDELSEKWQDLTDIQQASITELLAGKHQGNVMSSLMNNFDIARQALEVSMNSEGSAMEEHEKWMESIEAKVNQLKAAWEGLSNSFLDSGFVKGAVSGLTGLIQVIDTLINKIGAVPTILTGVGIAAFVKNLS